MGLSLGSRIVAARRPNIWLPLGQDDDMALGASLGTFGVNTPRFELKNGRRAILLEPGATNLIQYSHELENAWFGQIDLTGIDVNGITAPDGELTADGLIATAVDASHGLSSPYINGFSPDEKVVLTAYAKPGDKNWVFLRIYFYSVAFVYLGHGDYYFNIDSGAAGSTVTAGTCTVHDYIIEEAANDFYRVGLIASSSHVDVNKVAVRIYSASADLAEAFTGDAVTVNTWAWGLDLKKQSFFDSYIPTSGSAASRTTESGYPSYTLPADMFAETLSSERLPDGAFNNISKDDAKGVVGITKANPGVVTFDAAHSYVDGDVIYFSGLTEMTELNGQYWKLRNKVGDTFELSDQPIGTWDTSSLDTSGYGAAEVTGGDCAQRCRLSNWNAVFSYGWNPGVDGAGALTYTADCDGTQTGDTNLWRIGCLIAGELVKSVFTLSNYTSGDVQAKAHDKGGTIQTANGTYPEYLVCTGGANYYFTGNSTFVGSIDDVSAKGVTNGWDNLPPHFTLMLWVRFGYTPYSPPADINSGIIAVTGKASSTLWNKMDDGGVHSIHSNDETAEVVYDLSWSKNTWYKLCLQVGYLASNVLRFRIGIDTGSGVAWGTAGDYDGAYDIDSYLRLAYDLFGPMHIADIKFFRDILSDTKIDEWGSP